MFQFLTFRIAVYLQESEKVNILDIAHGLAAKIGQTMKLFIGIGVLLTLLIRTNYIDKNQTICFTDRRIPNGIFFFQNM